MMARRFNKVGQFFDGFNAAYDTTGKVIEGLKLSDIAGSKPEDFQQYSPEQAAQLEALANDPNTTLSGNDSGGYRATNNDTGEATDMRPGLTRSMFRGKTYDKPPSDAEQNTIRANDMADVIARRDPVKAMQLRHDAIVTQNAQRVMDDQNSIRSAFSGQDASQVRGLQRIQPGPSHTEGQGSQPSLGVQRIQPLQNIGGNYTTDPGFAKSMADSESFVSGEDVQPAPAYRVPGRGTYTSAEDAIGAQQQGQDDAQLSGSRPDYATADAALQRGAARPARDAYFQRKAPQIIDAYLKQGNIEGAKKYRDFIDSEEGRDYTHQWSHGVRKLSIGDYRGALKDWQALYNQQLYDDGRTVKLTPLQDGKQVQADFFDQAGNQVHSVTYPIDTLARQAGMALAPEKLVELRAQQDAKRSSEGVLLDRQIQMEQMRQQGQEVRDDRRDERLGMRIDAQGEMLYRRLSASGGLTPTQQRSNAEIDAARRAIVGMPQSEILRRSQKATNTGRENPDYNPSIARAANLAGRRKIGADDHFDSRTGQPSVSGGDITSRFAADPSMRGMRQGNQTPRGVEVYDQSGRLVGHYR